MAGQEVEVCELISNFQQYSTAFERLSPRLVPVAIYVYLKWEEWEKIGVIGCGAREAWEGIPARLKLTPISSHPKDT